MRVLNLAFAATIAMFAVMSSGAHASWKGSVFGDNTSSSARFTQRAQSNQQRTTSRATSSRRATRKARVTRQSSSGRSRRGGSLSGLASYYWQPQRVASGGWFNPNALTAAHKTLPFGTRVRVTNLRNGRSVVVRINDRGPYVRGRVIDLSKRAAGVVGMQGAGVVPVRVQVL